MVDDLKAALERANVAARDLGMIAEALDRNEPDPAKRVALIPLTVAVGEFRDRLAVLTIDARRAGLVEGVNP